MFTYDGFVTWIQNPSHFYVRIVSDNEKYCNIEQIIEILIQEKKLKTPEYTTNPEEIDFEFPKLEKSQHVLAHSRKIPSKKLLRGKILKIYYEEILGWHYFINFIDYGHSDWIRIDEIFLMPEQLMLLDGLAYKCNLSGIHPDQQFGDGWSLEAISTFKEIFLDPYQSCRLQSFLMLDEFRTNFIDVTAKIYVDKEEKKDFEWMNVKDYLLFQGHGQLMNPRSKPKQEPIKGRELLLSSGSHLVAGSVSVARLSYFNHPSDGCVHLLSVVGEQGKLS